MSRSAHLSLPPLSCSATVIKAGIPPLSSKVDGGLVKIHRPGMDNWVELLLSHGHAKNSRSLGVANMSMALRTKRPHRASGELCYHVLDVMHAIHDVSQDGKHIELHSTCTQPAALPLGLSAGMVD